MKKDWETLVPLLAHIQANLDRDLSLAALSRKAGLSPFHFQRVFKATIGETLRLRLERGAFRLFLHDSNLFDIALECGFQNHETFTRAFQRRPAGDRDAKVSVRYQINHTDICLPVIPNHERQGL